MCYGSVGVLWYTVWYAGVLDMFVVGKSIVGKNAVVLKVVSNDAHRWEIPTGMEFTSWEKNPKRGRGPVAWQ